MSFTTQIDYVVTGLELLELAVKDLGALSLAQNKLTTSSNELTRQLITLTSAGFDKLNTSLDTLVAGQAKAVAATKQQTTGIAALAAEIRAAGAVTPELTAKITQQEVAARGNAVALTSMTLATTANVAAVREASIATSAYQAATSQLSAQYSKIATVIAERTNLESGATAAMDKRLATEKALTAVAQQLYAADKLSLMGLQQRIIAESELTATQKLRAMQELGLVSIIDDVDRANKNSSKSTADLHKNTTDLDGASKLLKNSQTELGSAFRGVGAATGTLFLTYGQLVPMITAFVAVAGSIKAIKLGAEFEAQAQYIAEVEDATEGAKLGFDGVYKSLLDIKGVGQTPRDLAEAVTELVKAGVGAEEAIGAVSDMAKMATVVQGDLLDVTDMVLKQYQAWGPAAQVGARGVRTMSEAMDVIAIVMNQTSASMDNFKTALKYITPLAQLSGASFKDLAAAAGVLANAGLEGSVGTTALRTSLTKLAGSASGLVEEFANLGVVFNPFVDEAKGTMKQGTAMLEEFFNALSKLPDNVKTSMGTAELGMRGFASVAVTAGGSLTTTFNELRSNIDLWTSAMSTNAKYVGTIFEELSTTAQFKMSEFSAALERAWIKAFNSDVMKSALDNLIAILDSPAFQNIADSVVLGVEKLILAFSNLFATGSEASVLLNALSYVATGVSEIVSFMTGNAIGQIVSAGGILAMLVGVTFSAPTVIAAVVAALALLVGAATDSAASIDLAAAKVALFNENLGLGEKERAKLIADLNSGKTSADNLADSLNKLGKAQWVGELANVNAQIAELDTQIKNAEQGIGKATRGLNVNTTALKENRTKLEERRSLIEFAAAGELKKAQATNQASAAINEQVEYMDKNKKALNAISALNAKTTALKLAGAKEETNAVKELTESWDKEYAAEALALQEAGVVGTQAAQQLAVFDKELRNGEKATKDLTAAKEKDAQASDKASKATDELTRANNELAKAQVDAMPDGLDKDLAAWAADYEANVAKIADSHRIGTEAAEKYYASFAGTKAEGEAKIIKERLNEYSDAVDDLSNQLDNLSGKDKTLSVYEKELENISNGFAKWKNAAEEVAEKLKGQTNPAVIAMREYLEALIAKAEALEPAMKTAFATKLVEDFDKSLKTLAESFDELTPYESTLKGIQDKFQAMRDEANKNWKEGTAGATTLAQKLKEIDEKEQKVIKNNTELAKQGNSLWDGFVAGAKDAAKEMTTLGELGYEAFGTLETAWKDGFYAVITGDMDSLSDVWDTLLSSLLRAFSDFVAQLLLKWAAAKILDMTINVNGSSSGYGGILESIGSLFSSSGGGPSALSSGSAGGDIASLAAAEASRGTAWQTAGGYLGMAAGAYGVYSGVSNISKGNYGTGALQTGIGGVAAYKGAVAADLIAPGTASKLATEFGASVKGYFAKGAATEIGTQIGAAYTAEAYAALAQGGASYGMGSASASLAAAQAAQSAQLTGTTYASFQSAATVAPTASGSTGALGGMSSTGVLAAFAVLATLGNMAHMNNLDPSLNDEFNGRADGSLTPRSFESITAPFMDAMGDIEGTTLSTIDRLKGYDKAMYDSSEAALLMTGNGPAIVEMFDSASQSWYSSGQLIGTAAAFFGNTATSVSMDTVAATGDIVSSFTGMDTSLADSAGIANLVDAAINAANISLSENADQNNLLTSTTSTLTNSLMAMGMTSTQAAQAADQLTASAGGTTSQQNALSEAMTIAGASSAAMSGSVMSLYDSTGALITQFDTAQYSIQSTTDAITGAANGFEVVEKASDSATNTLSQSASGFTNLAETSTSAAESLSTVSGSISEATTAAASAISTLSSSLGGFAVAAGSTADSLRKATGSFDEAISSGGSRAMGGIIGRANGGAIGLASGGLLTGGSGMRDDLYIGSVDGVKYMAMGGEFVVNKRATANNRELLEAINDGKNISGGGGQVIHNHFYVDGKEISTTIMPAVDKYVTNKSSKGLMNTRLLY